MTQLQLPHIPRPRGRQYRFSLFRRLIDYRWEEIEFFIRTSRKGMKAASDQFNKDFDRTTAGWSQDRIQDHVEWLADEISMLRDGSPVLMHQSHCLIVYGTFEHMLADICRTIHSDQKIAKAPPDKIYMDDAKGYLRPHIGTRPAPFDKEWQWLHEFRIIRNWLAHAGGQAQQKLQPGNWVVAQQFVRRNRGLIRFERHNDIVVEAGLVDRAISKAKAAIIRIEKAADKLYP